MYNDNPDWRLYFGTIENMYKENGVASISQERRVIYKINKDLLYECYNTFIIRQICCYLLLAIWILKKRGN